MDSSPICTAFCTALQSVVGEGLGNVLLVGGSAALLAWNQRRTAKRLDASVQDANARAERADERAQRATEHAQLLAARVPAGGYEMIVRPSSPTSQARAAAPQSPGLAEELEGPGEPSEPEPTFGTQNYENIRRELGLMFDEHGNRRPPAIDEHARTTAPRAPTPPKRRP